MKRYLLALIALMTMTLGALAQNQMLVNKKDGSVVKISVDEIESVTWEETQMSSKAVDLGLSVKWASMNIGAEKPEDYGGYYAWGETEEKAEYSLDNYSESILIKYAPSKKTQLDPEDDVAHVKWGGSWRMPTKAEIDELITKCTWNWTSKGGHDGYVVIGPNGNSIFLPSAGYRNEALLKFAGEEGYYWSSTLSTSVTSAYELLFYSEGVEWSGNGRYGGQPIRAVCP